MKFLANMSCQVARDMYVSDPKNGPFDSAYVSPFLPKSYNSDSASSSPFSP